MSKILSDLDTLYHSLDKENGRWLENYHAVGGWPLDLEDVGLCLLSRLKEVYKINECPPEFVTRMNRLIESLQETEIAMRQLIVDVGCDLQERYKK
jgi:hypothetical protein